MSALLYRGERVQISVKNDQVTRQYFVDKSHVGGICFCSAGVVGKRSL